MFGYITVNKEELKIRDYETYHAYYCGICQDLKEYCGQRARMTLTYDMTFLAILLSGLYEETEREEKHRCLMHPAHKKRCIRNACTRYAAEMNLLLVYHNLMDDWEDERKIASLAAARLIRTSCERIAAQYPRQAEAVAVYLEKLHRAEAEQSKDLDLAAGLTGQLMQEIYCFREDIWSDDLKRVGFYIGKFIYLMDAWEDVPKDRKTGNYNPFLFLAEQEQFQERAREILVMMASEAAHAFERLPILENVDILRNILYSGIWMKYYSVNQKRLEEKNKKNAGSI